MNLGEVVHKLFAGNTPTGRIRRPETPAQMIERGLKEAGGVSQLARALGVERTTVQRWNKGSTPNEESQQLLRSVLRRVDVSEKRLARVAQSDRLVVTGKLGDGTPRTVKLGPYLAPGTMQRAADAFVRGASPADLHLIVWTGITGDNGGYRWMFQPPNWADAGRAERERLSARAERLAEGPSAAGGAGGLPGGTGGADDEDEDDYLDEYDEGYDDDAVMWDGGANDDYAFSASGARN